MPHPIRQHRPINGTEHWQCTCCKAMKPERDFTWSVVLRRPVSWCRDCMNASSNKANKTPGEGDEMYLEKVEEFRESAESLGVSYRSAAMQAFDLWQRVNQPPMKW